MDAPAKQQIIDRVKQANNILVTVSTNPTVDQLSACIGLTLLLNKMGKHATAVFSGKPPSTIEFLQPEKTLETNTDSLRDFIISLDKNKADKLRYKVEDQVVRIFITPYKTSISEKDLIFSEGDFNVEVVMALGVKDRAHVDAAITAHGRILHDATVVSLNAGQGNAPDVGQINWQDPTASSLSEMIVSISEAFAPGLIDNQMATAFLTGIVAETQRFSNPKTSPKVMTMSAQLMAAGANQQLIVSKLEPPPPPPPKPAPPPPAKPPMPPLPPPPPKPQLKPEAELLKDKDGTLNVAHAPSEADSQEIEIDSNEIHIDEQGNLKTANDVKTDEQKQKKSLGFDEEKKGPELSNIPVEPPPPPAPEPPPPPPPPPAITAPPTPSITSSYESVPKSPHPQISEDDMPGHHALLNPLERKPIITAPFTANTGDTSRNWEDPYNSVTIDPLTNGSVSSMQDGLIGHERTLEPSHPAPQTASPPTQPAAPVPTAPMPSASQPVLSADEARKAVESALASQPFDPAFHPEQRFGSTPVNLPIHTPPPPPPPQPVQAAPVITGSATTPSLTLPTGGYVAPQAPSSSASPPPYPPPLPPTPGVSMPAPGSQPNNFPPQA